MKKKRIELLVTDLDDTIWNWFEMWHVSFSNYLENVSRVANSSREVLLDDFRALHKKYRSSEFSFAFRELKTVARRHYSRIEKDRRKGSTEDISPIHQYYRDRKVNLRLYPGVLDSLAFMKSRGTRIVGFTESNSFFTRSRIIALGLDGVFDAIYSPKDIGLPKSVKRFYPKGHYDLKLTKQVDLPNGIRKPNPEILRRIIENEGVHLKNALYVGDKLDRDVSMANALGVRSCYARYGDNSDDEKYALLRKVSHWSDEEIQREIDAPKAKNTKPTVELGSFIELIHLFDFRAPKNAPTDEDKKNLISIWSSVVEVQKHFNDIELRIRSLAITIFTFLVGGIGYSIKENIGLGVFGVRLTAASLVAEMGIIILLALYMMDRHWYHRFLHSSVRQGMDLEIELKKIYPQMSLTTEIKDNSPFNVIGKFFRINSNGKIRIFYILLMLPFFLISIFYQYAEPARKVISLTSTST